MRLWPPVPHPEARGGHAVPEVAPRRPKCASLSLSVQMTLLMLVWVGAFTLPWLYTQCQHALDTLVEEAVDLAAMLLSLHSRPVLAAAGAAGLLAGGSMAASGPTVCLASAAAAGGGILWYNHLRVVGALAAPQLSPEQQPQQQQQQQQQGPVARRALLAAVMDDLD